MKKETMTSRQRVINAINHRPVDRVPIDLGMHLSTGISAFTYKRLREVLGLSTEHIEIASLIWMLARVDEDILERFHCDCVMLSPPYPQQKRWKFSDEFSFNIPAQVNPVKDKDGSWRIYEGDNSLYMPSNALECGVHHGWSEYFSTMSEGRGSFIDAVAENAERIYKDSDYATMAHGPGGGVGNDEKSLFDFAFDPIGYRKQIERNAECDIEYARTVIDKMGKYIQGYCLGADLGTQEGPIVNPRAYAEMVAPSLKRVCDFIHENSDLKIMNHCCGSIEPFIPIFIECGIDILNPVQISAKNMDPAMLKDKYGDKLVFWGGGCDTQNVLSRGTPEDVQDNVEMLVNIFKKNSGFVFNQVQDIMGDVSGENVVAMLDAAYENSFLEE